MKPLTFLLLHLEFFIVPLLTHGQNSRLIIGADSTVACTVFEPPLSINDLLNYPGGNNTLNFDFSNDDIPDLEFNVDAYIAPMSISNGTANAYSFHNSLEFACDTYYYAWPDTLALGDTLQQSMKSAVWTSRLQWPDYPFNLRYVINGNGGSGGTGLWQDTGFHYLAFRFISATDTLYGYVHLFVDVAAGSSGLSINAICYQGSYKYLSGIKDPYQSHIEVTLFPNPAVSTIQIICPQKGKYLASLMDLYGRKLNIFQFTTTCTADISSLPAGCYFVYVESESQHASVLKFIKR